ncbi:MAG TPA: hypothetical protein VHH73_08600 [Verrucomicrobiae bacterium]|nr:hypothetical protein [Verrucomicrobiae bacterium]
MDWLRLLPRRWHVTARWWEVANHLARVPERDVESVVIPCVGAKYVAEARLCARFAARNLPAAREIIIATDQPPADFGELPAPARVEQVRIPAAEIPDGHPFANIWHSRLMKLRAPLLARHDVVLMIDSDLLLLRSFRVPVAPGVVYGTLFRGKIGHRMKKHLAVAPELRAASRLWVRYHINGGFLLADGGTWQALSERWTGNYQRLWHKLPAETPVDQIPLVQSLDELGILTVDLGPWHNWSVPKRAGGITAPLPPEVIGAHGGFPLSEWERYWGNPQAALSFLGEDYTRKTRYQKAATE